MVLLKASEGGKLSFLCSDCGVLARALSPCEVKEIGEIAVVARRFNDLIRAVSDKSPIEIKVEAKVMQIKAGRSRFKLPTMDAKDYPRMNPEKAERLAVCFIKITRFDVAIKTGGTSGNRSFPEFLLSLKHGNFQRPCIDQCIVAAGSLER